MDVLKITKAYLREVLSSDVMDRIPEPELLMELREQVLAYQRGASFDGSLAPVHYYAVSEASKVMSGCRTVVDLGIGSGHVITKMAMVNPNIQFVGLDLSDEMLKVADAEVKRLNLKNIRLEKMDITKLHLLQERNILDVDGVMSTMALHHLPDVESLHELIASAVNVINSPKKSLFFFDFGRIKNDSTIKDMLGLHSSNSDILFEDGFNSQKAAFTIKEFKEGFEKLKDDGICSQIQYQNIFIVPYLLKIHSQSHQELTSEQKEVLNRIFESLSEQNKRLVNIMKLLIH